MKHLVDLQDIPQEDVDELLRRADDMLSSVGKERMDLHRKRIASLFYEPSTRTRLSFEAAMMELGGNVIGTENAGEFSSAAKGESLEDSIRVISGYVHAIVLRHKEKGAAKRAAEVSTVPIINAGDGTGQHPSQALLDLFTIQKELGQIEGTTIAMVGDLKNGRTVRSLCYLLGRYKDIKIVFISPEYLKMESDIKDYLRRHQVHFEEKTDLNEQLPKTDIVYMTRIQKERMSEEDQKKGSPYGINEENLNLLQSHARLMHPLPHVEEINLPIQTERDDSRVAYFRQARNGLPVRMALLSMLIKPNGAE